MITTHNLDENIRLGLNHHEIHAVTMTTDKSLNTPVVESVDPQIESIKNELTSLPAGTIVVLVQSTNFRLSTFRIRLELFHRGIHVVEHNHLAYIPEHELDTLVNCLQYRTDEYTRLQNALSVLTKDALTTRIQSVNGDILTY